MVAGLPGHCGVCSGTLDREVASMVYSVMYKNVRTGRYDDWAGAQEALREQIRMRKPHIHSLSSDSARRAAAAMDAWLLALNSAIDPASERACPYVWVSEWDGIAWTPPGGGAYGVGPGDLALLRDYSNGKRDWTIEVKCRVTRVWAYNAVPVVDVVITGESIQFRRHGSRSAIPACYIRRRKP